MKRFHYSRTSCLIMTVTLIVTFMIALSFYGASVLSDMAASELHGLMKRNLSTLQLLHVVFRHGPRTPADTYPKDPHVNHTFYPYGWGHITNSGKLELYNIGSWLRKQYGNFLGSYYQPDLIHAQATGVPRTHMSLQIVLAALYPPKDTVMEWYTKLNWQPIPIYSQDLRDDNLLLVRTPCPRYFEALNEVLHSPQVEEEIQTYQSLFKELTKWTGSNFTEPEDIQSLYLTLQAEQEYGLKLPAWTAEYYPQAMQFLAEQSYVYNVWTREMQKIKAGPFLQKMFTEMQQKANNQLKPELRKLFIYTGHDSTIVNIMQALKIWQRQMPRYSAMILFELHRNKETKEYHVEIYFRNNPKEMPQMMQIPGCDKQCPLMQLIDLTEEVLLSQKDVKRCEAKSNHFTEPPLRGP